MTYVKHNSYSITPKANNTVEFFFPNIALVNSDLSKEEGSGLLKFQLSQKADLAENTLIDSKVSIQFNERTPLVKNHTHTIGSLAFSTAIEDVLSNSIGLSVYPNPFNQSTTFKIDKIDAGMLDFELYNAKGQLLRYHQFNSSSFNLHRKELKNGFYFYIIKQHGQAVSVGKLFIE